MNSSGCIDQVPCLLSNDHTKVNKKKPQQKNKLKRLTQTLSQQNPTN